MPSTSSTTPTGSAAQVGAVAASSLGSDVGDLASGGLASGGLASGGLASGTLARALGLGLLVLAVLAVPTWLLVFRGEAELSVCQPYFMVGLGAAVFAAIISVWLNGLITARRTTAAGGDAALTARLEGMRLQGLMAAGFGAKLIVLTIGVFALRAFPLRLDEVAADVKFVDLVSFAVTFAGASLVLQLTTAASIAGSLRRRARTD